MKKVSIVIPTYNEEVNVRLIYERLKNIFYGIDYSYELLFIDNYSSDKTREKIEMICKQDRDVKAIFNARNFGFTRSVFYGITQTTGDCTVLLFADMQDPPELILEFLKKWEQGYKIVIGIKNKSKENRFMYFVRKCYYKLIKKISDIDHIEQFTGFGLYDNSFMKVLKELDDPMPYLRGIVAEMGFKRINVYYEQETRKFGQSSFNFFRLYDIAMLGITSYSKVVMRMATILGSFFSAVSLLVSIITLLIKLVYWDYFQLGIAAILIGVFFLGSLQLFFIGLVGEYVLSINIREMRRPLVVEEKRINFEK
jgi:polyisoprenyl-phosphate glycosyltransferase